MNINILNIGCEFLNQIAEKYNIQKLSLFGSAARGDMNINSDIDMLVEFRAGADVSLFDLAALEHELSELYEERTVNVATKSVLINPYRRKSIESDLKIIYEQ